MYTASTPFWYVALKKVRGKLHTTLIPKIALFSAFSFVLMMFNLPLPGGTSGHATGAGLAAVVLGPWAGMLALSTALLIQALFFGDGGVTAYGANAFNMAIAGCLVTYVVYRILLSVLPKRTWSKPTAAAIGAYVAINVSALLAGIEFGIQPMLFKDALGHPLYAPFPLSIAIPAMLIGHLTIAGVAEFVITGGVLAYLQRTSPALLPDAPERGQATWKPALAALAVLVCITPLGLLATGHAWGEWSAKDFSNADTRTRIEKASSGAKVPTLSPAGLQHLSTLWSAPLRDYSPAFIRNAAAGYIASAIFGITLLAAMTFAFGALLKRRMHNAKRPVLKNSK